MKRLRDIGGPNIGSARWGPVQRGNIMVRVAATSALTVAWMVLHFSVVIPAWAQSAATTPVEAIALYQGPDREQKLLEGAKKEGSFNLYTSMIAADQDVLSEAFARKYGIKLQYWRASSEALLQRLVAEA